jgi:hypothetical protein
MITQGQLAPGSLIFVDRVVLDGSADLLEHLRSSGNFEDYRLYYTQAEYDNFHGQPHPDGNFYPDGVVVATYAGIGQGNVLRSPDATTCAQHHTCAACLANLCAWCSEIQRTTTAMAGCVPDVQGGESACQNHGPLLGLSSKQMKCHGTGLRPAEWVGPLDKSGVSQMGVADKAKYHHRSQGDPVEVTFFNPREESVDVFWVNGGREVKTMVLAPKASSALNSYVGHKFILKHDGTSIKEHVVVGEDYVEADVKAEHEL